MDAFEAAVLARLAKRELWGVDELPPDIDADLLCALDGDGLVEARSVTMFNQQRWPGDTVLYAPSHGSWFSPLNAPMLAGNWRAILQKRARDERSHPCEVRVTERGRAELARLRRSAAAAPTAAATPSTRTEVVLWEGAEYSERNVRLARTKAAYLEAHGNVAAARQALKQDGNAIGQTTFYDHLHALDRECPGWRDSWMVSGASENPENGVTVRTRGKSRGKAG